MEKEIRKELTQIKKAINTLAHNFEVLISILVEDNPQLQEPEDPDNDGKFDMSMTMPEHKRSYLG